jgi:hypothetical protein
MAAFVLANWFWVAVTFIYLGFVVLAVDAWLEPELHDKLKWRIGIVLVLLIFAGLFSWGIVFVPAPLPASAFITAGEYPPGTVISGINWKPEFTEARIDLENPTDRPYEDLNIVVRPTAAIVAIAQTTAISDVSFEDKNGLAASILDMNVGTGTKSAIPLVLVAQMRDIECVVIAFLLMLI